MKGSTSLVTPIPVFQLLFDKISKFLVRPNWSPSWQTLDPYKQYVTSNSLFKHSMRYSMRVLGTNYDVWYVMHDMKWFMTNIMIWGICNLYILIMNHDMFTTYMICMTCVICMICFIVGVYDMIGMCDICNMYDMPWHQMIWDHMIWHQMNDMTIQNNICLCVYIYIR